MYKKGIFQVVFNREIAPKVFEMQLFGDTQYITRSGQFINISVDGCYLRRPISVCDYDDKTVTIIYKVVGKGTEIMSKLLPMAELDILSGLGNGFNTALSGVRPLLIGGGVGLPPLYNLAKRLSPNKKVTVIMGFNTASEIFYRQKFEELGVKTIVTTVDGSYGIKGFVTDAIVDDDFTYVYTCGPKAMLKSVYEITVCDGQYSFEERMGCGFGGCMGCTCKTKYGDKRICVDGPVLEKGEIIW